MNGLFCKYVELLFLVKFLETAKFPLRCNTQRHKLMLIRNN